AGAFRSGPAVYPRDQVPSPAPPGSRVQRRVQNGVAIELALIPAVPPRRAGGGLLAGDDVVVRFTLTHAASGTPLTGVRPAAWLANRSPGEPRDRHAMARKVNGFLRGGLAVRPVLDLNTFHVLTLNGDASLTVIDPLSGFGGSKLLALVSLPGV